LTFRESYLARGGKVLPGAGMLPEEGDYDILKVFAKLVFSLMGSVLGFLKI
jgi:hypothetical protein